MIARGVQPRAFVAAVVVAAAGVSAFGVRLGFSPANGGLALVILVLAIVAMQFPLLVTPSVKVNTSSSAYFAAALTLDPNTAVVVVGLSQVGGGLILALRRNPLTGRPRRRIGDTAFNASQWVLATSAGAAVFHNVNQRGPDQSLRWLAAAVGAATTMYLLNTALVAAVAAVHQRVSPLEVWLAGRRQDIVTEAGLYVIGATASIGAPGHPWILLGLVIPTVLLHNSLQKTLQLQRQTVEAVEQMADLVDIRDGYTGRHSQRVADRAEQIARRLRLSTDYVATIRLAARVHDIGKIAIPDQVLHKPGRLDDVEWELMKTHVEAGCRVLERFADYRAGVELVRAHHERADGSGYPRGLRAAQIPLGAQVIGIADSIDAMASDRPYRSGMPLSSVVKELEAAAGSQFSADVVRAALESLGISRSPAASALAVRGAVI
jgi:HD domain